MIYINGKEAISSSLYETSEIKNTKTSSSFDSILEKETTIYAQPLSSNTQINPSASPTKEQTISTPFQPIFQKAAQQYQIDENLLKSVAKVESNYNPNVVSNAGAIGLMQLMPATASSLGVTNPYDPTQNIMGGAKYLSQMLQKYNGNISLALAAYNAGSGNVEKYNGIPPFKETQNYVQKVLDTMQQTGSTSTINTIYAVASKDATTSSQIYSIQAVPESSL